MIDYIKTHPTVTCDEFRDVWDNLDKATKDVSWLSILHSSPDNYPQIYKQ
jgi:hypothetical protein